MTYVTTFVNTNFSGRVPFNVQSVHLSPSSTSLRRALYLCGRAIVFVPHFIRLIRQLYLSSAVFLYLCYHVVLALLCGRWFGA